MDQRSKNACRISILPGAGDSNYSLIYGPLEQGSRRKIAFVDGPTQQSGRHFGSLLKDERGRTSDSRRISGPAMS